MSREALERSAAKSTVYLSPRLQGSLFQTLQTRSNMRTTIIQLLPTRHSNSWSITSSHFYTSTQPSKWSSSPSGKRKASSSWRSTRLSHSKCVEVPPQWQLWWGLLRWSMKMWATARWSFNGSSLLPHLPNSSTSTLTLSKNHSTQLNTRFSNRSSSSSTPIRASSTVVATATLFRTSMSTARPLSEWPPYSSI